LVVKVTIARLSKALTNPHGHWQLEFTETLGAEIEPE
jgi:hypothetical protein